MDNGIALTGGGRLTMTEEGVQVRLEVLRPNDGRGLYKVWLLGDGGRFLLGTLVPEGDGLCLRRRVSRSSLAQAGCWPVIAGECVLSFSFGQPGKQVEWIAASHPEGMMGDEVLRRAVRGSQLLLRRQSDGFCLAARFDPGRPFPVTALFCLAGVGELHGQPHVFFHFDREGMPVLPEKQNV